MCGRINVSDHEGVQALMAMLGMPLFPAVRAGQPKWNVSPTAILNAVVSEAMDERAALSDTPLRWGIAAPWSEPGKTVRPLINARSETLFSKPTFRDLAKQHRAIVPVSGFYEWERVGDERIPYFVQVQALPAMLLAAVFEPVTDADIQKEQRTASASPQMGFSFDDPNQEASANTPAATPAPPLHTGNFAIVTTEAIGPMAQVHHRTPVMLNIAQAKRWLATDDTQEIQAMMQPESVMEVSLRRVSRAVNSTRNDGPECLADAETESD